MEVKNAVIKDKVIALNDDGDLVLFLSFRMGNNKVLPVCFKLDGMSICTERLLRNLFAATRVSDWRDLGDKALRLELTEKGVTRIGHIVDDCWFELGALTANAEK